MMKRFLAGLITATGFLLIAGMTVPWNAAQAACNGDICWDDPDPVITARPPVPTPPPHCDPWLTDRPRPTPTPTPTPTPPAYDGDLTDVPHPSPPPEPNVPGDAQHAYMDCDDPPEETPVPSDSPEPSESPEPSDEPDEPGKDVEIPQNPELILQGSGTLFDCSMNLATAHQGWRPIFLGLVLLIPVSLRKIWKEKI